GVRRLKILPTRRGEARRLAEFAGAWVKPARGQRLAHRGKVHRDGSTVRQVGGESVVGLSQCDGGAGHLGEGLQAPEGQGGEKVVKRGQLAGRAFIAEDEAVVMGRVNPVPNITVADGAVESGGKVTSRADDAPRAATHFVRMMHLLP